MQSATVSRVALAGVGLVVIAAGGVWITAGRGTNAPRMPATTQARSVTPTPTPTAAPAPAGELVEFRDDPAGFALSYPKTWVRPASNDPQVPLVAAELDPAKNQGQGGSILVRITPLDAPVGKGQLAEARTATDAIVASGNGVTLKADPVETEQGGLPGLYYLYTFRDPVSGVTGAHSHFFLFKDRTMISMVFQAIPQGDFSRLGQLFDRVAGSLRVL